MLFHCYTIPLDEKKTCAEMISLQLKQEHEVGQGSNDSQCIEQALRSLLQSQNRNGSTVMYDHSRPIDRTSLNNQH